MTLSELIHWNRPSNIPVMRRDRLGRSILSLQEDMERLFEDFLGDTSFPALARESNFPAIDIIENEKTFKVKAEIAGMQPEDIEISMTDGFLNIKGEKQEMTEESDENYLRRESSYGSFQRTVALPQTANCDKAEATFKNGVLNIEVPKKAEAVHKPKKLNITKVA